MTDANLPTIPAEDGEITKILLAYQQDLAHYALHHDQDIAGRELQRKFDTALAALKAREQRIALEARINEVEITKTKVKWYPQLGHDGIEDTLIPYSELENRIAELTAHLSQLTQYNQSEREEL